MLSDFQLAALTKVDRNWVLLNIPLHQDLQDTLASSWSTQLDAFMDDIDEVTFDAGYSPEQHERFCVGDYDLPQCLQAGVGGGLRDIGSFKDNEGLIDSIKAIIAYARHPQLGELMLAQTFSRSHVIQPGRFLFLENDTYESPKRTGLTLGDRLAAVFQVSQRKLLFDNFRNTNAFLPLVEFIADASDRDIRDVLAHDLLKPLDVEKTVEIANQWFRKRFAMLRASKVLDNYSAATLRKLSRGYAVDLKVEKGKIVFPSDKPAAKRLLQFLNEEIFRGAITEKLYETNSKRVADDPPAVAGGVS